MALNPAPIGTLLKGPKPIKKKKLSIGRRLRGEEPKHLDAIRQCPCLTCGTVPAEAAHIRMNDGPGKPNPGIGAKPPDRYTVPLCPDCHRDCGQESQHGRGERLWWQSKGVNPLLIAAELHALSPDVTAMQAYIIAKVGKAL